jgi:hypothetical protein
MPSRCRPGHDNCYETAPVLPLRVRELSARPPALILRLRHEDERESEFRAPLRPSSPRQVSNLTGVATSGGEESDRLLPLYRNVYRGHAAERAEGRVLDALVLVV